jgi:glycine cleavage system H protein
LNKTNNKIKKLKTMFIPVNLHYTRDHLWLRDVGRQDAYAGITDYAQKELGRIDCIEIEHEGSQKERGDRFGVIYGANKCVDLIMPFTGQLLMLNPDIEKLSGIINSDPYHHWIVMLTAKDSLADNKTQYFTAEGYKNAVDSLKTRNK